MKRFLPMAVAALTLAACTETTGSSIAPGTSSYSVGQEWRIFGGQTPASTIDATGGWEVGTRFYFTVRGCITKLHFYRALGETGDNYIKVWTNSGTLLYSDRIANAYSSPGWKTLDLSPLVGPSVDLSICNIVRGTYYRVSVNTNTKQVKTFGYFDGGPVINGPLVADRGFFGQPIGSMPTQSSGSGYFVDVTFTET